MAFPESVLNAAEKAALKHPSDIDQAVKHWNRAVRRLPDFDEFAGDLILRAGRELIHDIRHQMNRVAKRESGEWHTTSKVSGSLDEIERITREVYFGDVYFIDGRTLSEIKGSELADVADSERATANGHEWNARLLDKLKPVVPKGKTVKQALSDKRLRGIVSSIER